MTEIATSVASTTSLITTTMGSVATALMSNEIFILVLGVIIFGIALGVIYSLVRKLKRRGR